MASRYTGAIIFTGNNTMDISTLRAMRKSAGTDFSKITGAIEKLKNPESGSKSFKDDRFWRAEPDKVGNASAVIRFLPLVEGDELPWVRVFSHSFQGPGGKWYIENSLTTIGLEDPVGNLNNILWNSGSEANKEIARVQKRKLSFISNILVVSDPKHPENNGKVFLFKYGKKIFDKIMDKARPTFEDDEPVNVFDLWEGADFKLRIKKKDGYSNYDDSVFSEPSAIEGTDEELVAIVNSQVKLAEFIDPSQFKSFDELSKKLDSVLNSTGTSRSAEDMMKKDAPEEKSVPAKEPKSKPAKEPKSAPIDDNDDDAAAFFQKMAEN